MTLSNSKYFSLLSQALIQSGVHQPTIVVDKQRLDENLDALLSVMQTGIDYRIVAKSLPSVPFIKYLMQRSGSNRLMSFHLPFLLHVAQNIPSADVLLGKPMTVSGARQFYQHQKAFTSLNKHPETFNTETQLHWLIDSLDRLKQYQALAKELNCSMNISLELDVGLHRGGFTTDHKDELEQALRLIKSDDHLCLTGMMGYEAHVSRIPNIVGGSAKAFTQSMASYKACVQQAVNVFGQEFCNNLILNAGGSSTYPLYKRSDTALGKQSSFITEFATASALVKPTDFDVHTLEHHKPACFIAAPVLKLVNNPEIPTLKGLSSLLRSLGLLPKQACFIYGGNWLATPCFPEGCKRSNILGHSSNQEMYELKKDHPLKMDDYLFFRPTQSEAVFLQFGDIALYEDGKIVDWWPIFHTDSHSKNTLCEDNSPEKDVV